MPWLPWFQKETRVERPVVPSQWTFVQPLNQIKHGYNQASFAAKLFGKSNHAHRSYVVMPDPDQCAQFYSAVFQAQQTYSAAIVARQQDDIIGTHSLVQVTEPMREGLTDLLVSKGLPEQEMNLFSVGVWNGILFLFFQDKERVIELSNLDKIMHRPFRALRTNPPTNFYHKLKAEGVLDGSVWKVIEGASPTLGPTGAPLGSTEIKTVSTDPLIKIVETEGEREVVEAHFKFTSDAVKNISILQTPIQALNVTEQIKRVICSPNFHERAGDGIGWVMPPTFAERECDGLVAVEKILFDALCALCALHSAGIAHGNIDDSAVLTSSDGRRGCLTGFRHATTAYRHRRDCYPAICTVPGAVVEPPAARDVMAYTLVVMNLFWMPPTDRRGWGEYADIISREEHFQLSEKSSPQITQFTRTVIAEVLLGSAYRTFSTEDTFGPFSAAMPIVTAPLYGTIEEYMLACEPTAEGRALGERLNRFKWFVCHAFSLDYRMRPTAGDLLKHSVFCGCPYPDEWNLTIAQMEEFAVASGRYVDTESTAFLKN